MSTNNPIVSLDNFHYVKVDKNTSEEYVTEKMERIEGVISAGFSINTVEGELYTDGARNVYSSANTSVDLTIDIASVPADILAEMLGRDYDEETGETKAKTTDVQPEISVAFRAVKHNGDSVYYRFPVAIAQITDSNIETRGSDINFQTENLVINCNPRRFDNVLYIRKESSEELEDFFDAENLDNI